MNESSTSNSTSANGRNGNGSQEVRTSKNVIGKGQSCCQNPCPHNSCVIACLRGARNGFYYASRIRFAHAFVMGFIFGSGTVKDRLIWAVRMAIRHGTILAIFAFTYKSV